MEFPKALNSAVFNLSSGISYSFCGGSWWSFTGRGRYAAVAFARALAAAQGFTLLVGRSGSHGLVAFVSPGRRPACPVGFPSPCSSCIGC